MSDDRNPTITITWTETVLREHTVSLPLTEVRALMAQHAPTYGDDVHDVVTGAVYDVKALSPLMSALASKSDQPPTEKTDDINNVDSDAPEYLCEDCSRLLIDHCDECDDCDCDGPCEECGECGCDGDCADEDESDEGEENDSDETDDTA